MVEQPETGAGEGDAVLAARLGDLVRVNRPAGFGDEGDAVTAGVVDVVAERKGAVGGERDPGKAAHPLGPLCRGR